MARNKITPAEKKFRETISTNLKIICDRKNITQSRLAELTGLPKTTINGYFRGTSLPSPGNIEKIATALGVTKDKLDSRFQDDLPKNAVPVSPQTIAIPILGKIACGDPILAEENVKGYHYESPDLLPSGEFFCLEANGNSMAPTIPDGSTVIIRQQPEVESGEIAAVLINGDTEATLKRVKKQGETIVLMPDNPNFDPIIVDRFNPAKIIGKAVKFSMTL